jgi:type II secretory pathway pseudopilin PulG
MRNVLLPQSLARLTRPRRAQRGFSLWEMALLVGVLALVISAGLVFLKAQEASQLDAERQTMLEAADRSILNFIAIRGRLPCPDSAGLGVENCAAGVQKGWLPEVTLGLNASAPGRGVSRLIYVAYRGAGADLGDATDRFSPARWDYYQTPSVATSFGPYSPAQVSVVDMCRGLATARAQPTSAATAHVQGPAGFLNVAYALADGGVDRDGNGNIFDGDFNTAAAPGLDSPTRAASSDYDDRVLSHDFNELSNLLNCATLTRSLDAMGQAVEVGNEVKSQAEATRLMSIVLSAVNGVKALVQTAKLIMSGIALASAIAILTAAASALGGAIGTCFVLVGCALIPGYAAATVAAAIGVGLATTTVGLNAAAVAYHVTATVQTATVAQKASSAVDPGSVNLTDLLAQVQQSALDAAATAAASRVAANAAASAYTASLSLYNSRVNILRDWAHNTAFNPGYAGRGQPKPSGPVDVDPGDVKLEALITAHKAYRDTYQAYVVADGEYQRDLKNYNYAVDSNVTAAAAAAASDPVTDPDYQQKQDIYAQSLTAYALARVANLKTISDQSAGNRTAKLNAYTAAWTTYLNAYVAVRDAYPYQLLPIFNLHLLSSYFGYFTNVDDAYADYLNKAVDATEKERIAVSDAQNAIDASTAVVALNAAIAAQQANGSASAVVIQGGEAILKEADFRGGLQ